MTNVRLPLLNVLPYILVLVGLIFSGFTAHESAPLPSEEFLVLAGGWFADADGGSPYSSEDVTASLQERGAAFPAERALTSSPALLFFMNPLKALPILVYSRIWFLFMLLSGWIGVLLLSSAARTPADRCIMLFFMVLMLTFRGPMITALSLGNIYPLLLLAAGISVAAGLRHPLAALSVPLFPLTAFNFSPLILALRGWKAWLVFLAVMVFLVLVSASVFGADAWAEFREGPGYQGEQTAESETDFSLSGALDVLTEGSSASTIRIAVILASAAVLVLQMIYMEDGFREFLSGSWSSRAILGILCWWVLLVSPVVHGHMGLLLLPLLPVSERFLGMRRALPVAVLIALWYFLPADTPALIASRPLICLAGIHYFAACLPGIPD